MSDKKVVRMPVVYSPERAAQILVLVQEGWTDERIAREMSINRSVIRRWRQERPEFEQAFRDAKDEAIRRKLRSAKGPGNRAKPDEDTEAALFDGLRKGCGRHAAAALAGVHPSTVERWLEEDQDFELRLIAAEAEFQRDTLDALDGAGPGAWQKYAWKLERRFGEVFAHKSEVSHTEKVKTAAKIGADLAEALLTALPELGFDAEQQERVRKTLAERLESAAQAG